MEIQIGHSLKETYIVQSQDLISDIDASLPPVLGTYNIVKWAEITSGKILWNHLPKNKVSVGMKVEIKHSAISLVGASIDVISTISSMKGPMVGFEIEVREGEETIASIKHLRAILPQEKLDQKIKLKQQAK